MANAFINFPTNKLNSIDTRKHCGSLMSEKERKNEQSTDRLEELSDKLDLIIKRLDMLETMILEKPEYESLAASLRLVRVGLGMYDEPLKVMSRMKVAQSHLKHEEIAKDDISRCIVQALALRSPLNISAITRQVQAMRGKSSRGIIRERLIALEQAGVVHQKEGFGKLYELVE